MQTPRSLGILSYAVNGQGLGHVVRLAGINRWLRRYAAFAGVKTQHWFLTTSEADTLLFGEGFAAFKLPSKSIVESAGVDKATYLALAKQWVWNTVALLRPEIFIADTFPNGSFDELMPVLDLCGKRAIVQRPVRDQISQRPAHQALLRLYDRVIVPEYPRPGEPPSAARHVGPMVLNEAFEALSRDEARAALGVPDDAYCLLVCAGGGGDEGVEALFRSVLAAVANEVHVHVVLAAGPLYRGQPLAGPGRTFLTLPGLSTFLPAVDGAIAAAGYNTVYELLLARVPAAVFSQNKVADDQAARVERLAQAGAILPLRSLTTAAIVEVVAQLRNHSVAVALSTAARQLMPRNHAREAAASILELVLPSGLLQQAVDMVDDACLGTLREFRTEVPEIVDVAVALSAGGRSADRSGLELEGALSLMRQMRQTGASNTQVVRVATQLGRTLATMDRHKNDIEALVLQAVSQGSIAGQWAAFASLLERVRPEPGEAAPAFIAALGTLLNAGAAQGMDLFALANEAAHLQTVSESRPSLRLLTDRLREQARA